MRWLSWKGGAEGGARESGPKYSLVGRMSESTCVCGAPLWLGLMTLTALPPVVVRHMQPEIPNMFCVTVCMLDGYRHGLDAKKKMNNPVECMVSI